MAESPKKTVLIVHEDLIEAAARSIAYLERGYHTLIAQNHEEVRALAQHHTIDCVLFPESDPCMESKPVGYLIRQEDYPKDRIWGRLTCDDQRPIRLRNLPVRRRF